MVSDLNIKNSNRNLDAMSGEGFCFVLYGMAYYALLLMVNSVLCKQGTLWN